MTNIQPSGGDDTKQIQSALKDGATLDFAPGTYKVGPIKLISNIKWNANGSTFQNISLSNTGTINNVNMNGGIYIGASSVPRIIELLATNSIFSNITVSVSSGKNSQHGFGLQKGSYGNKCTKITSNYCALADKGVDSGNEWTDCIYNGDSGTIDGFIIKCKNSTFTRCIVNGSKVAGFGFYGKDDTSNKGIEISGNKFIDCQANNNGHAGYSLNCPSNGPKANIHDNSIQGISTGNNLGGLAFYNNASGGVNQNNSFDIISRDNPGGGLIINKSCNNNSGSIISFSNNTNDISNQGTGNSITVYHPSNKPKPTTSGGNINIIDFDCNNLPNPPIPYCVQSYCGKTPPPTSNLTISLSITPSTSNVGDTITFQATVSGGTSPYTYTWSGRTDTTDKITCTAQTPGTFIAQVNVTDSQGNKASDQKQYVVNQAPIQTTTFDVSNTNNSITVSVSTTTGISASDACKQVCDYIDKFP